MDTITLLSREKTLGFQIRPSDVYWRPSSLVLSGQDTTEISFSGLEREVKHRLWRESKHFFENPATTLVGNDIKHLYSLLHHYGIRIASRLIDPGVLSSLHCLNEDGLEELSPLNIAETNHWLTLLEDPKIHQIYKHLVLGMLPVTAEMENCGVHTVNGGIVYPNYNLGLASSGRLVCRSEGNMFNPHGVHIKERGKYVPEPGHMMIIADQSSMEMRVLAHLSRDQNLLSLFEEDRDIYEIIARWLLKKPANCPIKGEERKLAKAVAFLIVFGGTPYGLSRRMKISLKESNDFILSFFRAFPGVESWVLQTQIQSLESGQVESLFGRVRKIDPESEIEGELRSMQNFCVQSPAADINSLSLRAIHHLRPSDSRILLYLHDGFVLSSTKKDLKETIDLTRQCMQNPPGLKIFGIKFDIPLRPKIKVSPCWN